MDMTEAESSMPFRYIPVSDQAVLVELGTTIDAETNDLVHALDSALAANPFPGFREAIPAYVNILVLFDPLVTDHATVTRHLRQRAGLTSHAAKPARTHSVEVCYEPAFAPDLAEVSERTGLSGEAVINAHLAGDYRVYLYGFAPGYAYMAGLPAEIQLPRKPAPVPRIPAGSVIIAGPQTLVTTLLMPTGWWIIGRSPTPILTGDPAKPFLFDVGDKVKFVRVSAAKMGAIANG